MPGFEMTTIEFSLLSTILMIDLRLSLTFTKTASPRVEHLLFYLKNVSPVSWRKKAKSFLPIHQYHVK